MFEIIVVVNGVEINSGRYSREVAIKKAKEIKDTQNVGVFVREI